MEHPAIAFTLQVIFRPFDSISGDGSYPNIPECLDFGAADHQGICFAGWNPHRVPFCSSNLTPVRNVLQLLCISVVKQHASSKSQALARKGCHWSMLTCARLALGTS